MTKRVIPTELSDFMVFHGERSVRDREELRCRNAQDRTAGHARGRRGHEESSTKRKREERWRRERRKILRVSPTRGRWSTEPPPRTVCHPPDGFGACARRALVSSRLGLGLFQSVDQPVRLSRADGFLRLPESIGVHRRVSPLGRSVGHRSLPDSPVPPRRRVSRSRVSIRCREIG